MYTMLVVFIIMKSTILFINIHTIKFYYNLIFTLMTFSYHQQKQFLYFNSFHNVLKSMAFLSGGVQKYLDSTNLLLHSKSSSCSQPI